MKYSIVASAACISGASLVSSAPTPNHATGSHNPTGRPYAHEDAAYSIQGRGFGQTEPARVKQSTSDNQFIPRSVDQELVDPQAPRPDVSRLDSDLTASAIIRKDKISKRGYGGVSDHEEEEDTTLARRQLPVIAARLMKAAAGKFGRVVLSGIRGVGSKLGSSVKSLITSKAHPTAGSAAVRNKQLGASLKNGGTRSTGASPSTTQRTRTSDGRNPSSSSRGNANNYDADMYNLSGAGGGAVGGAEPQYPSSPYGSEGYGASNEYGAYGNSNGGYGGGLTRRAPASDSAIIARHQTQANIVSRDLQIDQLD